jgi:plastocyanin
MERRRPRELDRGAITNSRAPRRVLLPLIALLSLGSMTLACSNDSPGPLVVPGDTPDSIAPDGAVIELHDVTLDPRVVEITEGGSVVWLNRDRTGHQLVSLAPNVFSTPRLNEGESHVQSFTKPGTYPYFCTIHNEMKGTIVVYYAH